MATLHLRGVPDDLDAELTRDAARHGTSKNRRAIAVLRRGLGLDPAERAAVIEDILRNRGKVKGDVNIAQLIRDGRPDGDD